MKKTIGILGGMGPLATADLFRKIVLMTRAGCDNEHIRIYIDNNCRIPDRTAAILQGGADPVPEMSDEHPLPQHAGGHRQGLRRPLPGKDRLRFGHPGHTGLRPL